MAESKKPAIKEWSTYLTFARAIKKNDTAKVAAFAEHYNCNSMVTLIIPGIRDKRFPVDFAMAFGNEQTCDALIQNGMQLNTLCQNPFDKKENKLNPIIAAYAHERDDLAAYLMETYPHKIDFETSFSDTKQRLADFFVNEGAHDLAKIAHHAEIKSHKLIAKAFKDNAAKLTAKANDAYAKAAALENKTPQAKAHLKPVTKKFQR